MSRWLKRSGYWIGVGLIVQAMCFDAAAAQKDQKDEQRENERVRQAQQAVNQAQDKQREAARDLAESSKVLNKAEAEKRLAVDRAQQVRKQVEEQQETRFGLPALLRDQEAAQRAYDAVAVPILETLKSTAPYLAAVADAKLAHDELQAARRSAAQAGAVSNDAVSALVRRTLKPSELEKAALEANPPSVAAKQSLSKVQEKIKAARELVKAAVEKDTALRGALRELEQHNTAVDRARFELARDREKLASAAAKLEQERDQLARATAADRKDDNKNKKKKNDNKKK